MSGHVGTCTPVPNGGSDPKSRCAATVSTSCGLDGACDGGGKCRFWGTSTGCRNQSCTGVTQTNGANCNGAGACAASTTKGCDPYLCDATGASCKTTCATSADCNMVTCNTQTNKCGDKLPVGKPCAVGTDCASGFCAKTAAGAGICCNTACNTAASCSATQGIGASFCSASGACQVGTTAPIDDNNVCTTDACNATTGQVTHTNNTLACGAASCAMGVGTTAGTCSGGTCKGSMTTTVDDKNPCTVDTCDASGAVSHTPVANGTSCSDGDPCNGTEVCQAGACKAGTPVTCKASDSCHVAGKCDSTTGACTNPAAKDGASCDDGNACTTGDACQAGSCAGKTTVCPAPKQCQKGGTCDATSGMCTYVVDTTGPCDDGNACTTGDTCNSSGVCTGVAVTCDAPNQCQKGPGTCKGGTCSYEVNKNAPCDDGDPCTMGEKCNPQGVCTGGKAKDCSASDECHDPGACITVAGIGTCTDPTVKADNSPCTGGVLL